MWVDSKSAGLEFFEDGGVFANEIDGASGDSEGFSILGDDGEWEGLGGFGFDEVLEVKHGSEVFLSLDGVVEASVSDPFDGRDVDQGAVVFAMGVVTTAAERTEN